MYGDILVPTDGSEAARRAASEALALARKHGATVHAIYVVDEGAGTMLTSSASMSTVLEELTEEGEQMTEEVALMAERMDSDVEVTTDVVRGVHVDQAILKYVEDNDIDLVVMGTSGRRGLDHLLGSTTERVLARSSVPVLVLRADGE